MRSRVAAVAWLVWLASADSGERLAQRLREPVEVSARVGEGKEARLVRRRRQIYTAVQHGVEQGTEAF